ncbi:MAG: hypothetical protein SF029_15050 [bacterium]|nr:hypothetical protein [bacterium]
MTWTTPKTDWQEGDIVAASDMNALGTNLNALKTPPTALVTLNEAADFTTTSTTFTDVNTTRLSLTLATTGGAVLVTFAGSISLNVANSAVYFDLLVNGSRIAGDDGILVVTAASVAATNASFTYWLTNLPAGTHTIRLQWKVPAGTTVTMWAGAGTALADLHPQFAAREVS